jgi:hypothetical protein
MVTSMQIKTRLQAALASHGTRSVTSAERATGIDRHMIQKWSRRLQDTGGVLDAPRSGRPKTLSDEACKHLERLVDEHPGISLRALAMKLHDAGVCDHVISHSTIKAAIDTRCPDVSRVSPLYEDVLKPKQKQCRVDFARRHARGSWRNVLCVDACKFTYAPARRHTRQGMLAYKGKRPVMKMGDKHTGLCVYGAVSFKGKSPLVLVTGSSNVEKTYKQSPGKRYSGVGAEEYINIMHAHLIPAGRKLHGGRLVYLHDWSGCHKSRRVKAYQQAVGLAVMKDFPSCSPDINIIENVWAWIDSELRKKKYNNLDDFKAQLIATWESVPLTLLHNCVRSIKPRLQAIVRAGGDRIKTQGL